MQLVKSVLGLAALAVLVGSCNNVDFKKTKGGVPYKIFSADGKGDSAKLNSVVKFEVIQKVKDSVLFSSYKEGAPQYAQIQAVPTPVNYNDLRGNLMEILSRTKKGDSVYFVQSVDSLIKQNPEIATQTKLKKGDQITTTLRVVDVYKSPAEANAAVMKDRIAGAAKMESEGLARFRKDTAVQAQMKKDDQIIADYLKAHNVQAQKTDWGIYVQTLNPGQGPKPAVGQYANVKYQGMDLQGKTFDAGVFPIQVGVGGSIKGFEEGVKQLSKGGKARIYIPSVLGYGPAGSPPKIQPNQILVFDIETLNISDTPPAPTQGAPANADTTGRR